MAKRKNRPYAKRIFLNPIKDGAPAFIQAVADSSDNGSYLLGNYLLIIADCERRITLEFPLASKYLRKRNLAKADRLVQVVNDFRAALAKEIALIEKTHGTTKTQKARR
jgi:hypothetical protein